MKDVKENYITPNYYMQGVCGQGRVHCMQSGGTKPQKKPQS